MAIWVVVGCTVLVHIGFAGVKVSISLYAIAQGATPFTIGVIMSLFGLFPSIFAVTAGRVVDRVGARRPMALSSLGIACGILLPYLFLGVTALFAAAVLLGIAVMFYMVTVQSMTGSIGAPEDRSRNYGYLSLGFAGASVLGPLVAGFAIDHLGNRMAFPVLMAPVLVPAIALLVRPRLIPNARVKAEERHEGSVMDLLKIPALRNTFIASGILSSAWDLYQFFLPIYGHSIGLSASAIGMILSTFAVAIFVVRVFLPYMLRHISEAGLMVVAISVAGIAYLLFPVVRGAAPLAAVSFLLGMGLGLGQPLSMTLIYNLTPKGRVGEASGVRVTLNNMAHVVIPMGFGAMSSAFGYVVVFLANAAFLGVGAYVCWRGARRGKPA